MKKVLSISCIVLISIGVNAQSSDDINLVQSLWGKEKRAIVEEYMGISTGSAFWAEYDSYDLARKKIAQEKIGIMSKYADNYGNLTDDIATKIINESASNNIAMQKLLQKTFKKMSKVISPREAAKFVQLENYLISAILMSIQQNVPFIGELDDMRVE